MNAEQETRVRDLLADLPWDDLDGALRVMEECLRLALDATRHALVRWDEEADDRFSNEFSLTSAQVDDLPLEFRLAYVARLVKSLALNYASRPSTGLEAE